MVHLPPQLAANTPELFSSFQAVSVTGREQGAAMTGPEDYHEAERLHARHPLDGAGRGSGRRKPLTHTTRDGG
jgi:hypothetical protein